MVPFWLPQHATNGAGKQICLANVAKVVVGEHEWGSGCEDNNCLLAHNC